MRLLIIEDERKVADIVARGLRAERFAVDVAYDGERGWEMASLCDYDLIILDLMLPGPGGSEILRRLRHAKKEVPVLILTARESTAEKVENFEAGADDYLTKPFAFSELSARVQALIRRATQTAEPSRLSAGDLEMDLLTREVRRGGEKIELQAREFALLEYLMRHAGRPVTKTMILEHIFDYSFDPQTNVVDVLMHRLRAKADPDKTRLQTLRGVGYVLK